MTKKNIFLIVSILLIIPQVSCGIHSSYTEDKTLQLEEKKIPTSTSNNIDEIYVSKVLKKAKGESVAKSFIEDFAMDGNKEAFILTRKEVNEMESKFSLWFVSDAKVEALKKDILALSSSTIELIKNNKNIHVLFREEQFTINNDFTATIYGVHSGEPIVFFEKNYIKVDIQNNKIYGTETQYCYYDFNLKGRMISTGVSYEFFWDEQDEKYMEYGATVISKSEFLQYSGGKEIWNKLEKEMSEKNQKLKYTILKRTNNTIDINMEITSKDGRYETYITLPTRDGKILTTKIDFHDGNKKSCKYPEMVNLK